MTPRTFPKIISSLFVLGCFLALTGCQQPAAPAVETAAPLYSTDTTIPTLVPPTATRTPLPPTATATDTPVPTATVIPSATASPTPAWQVRRSEESRFQVEIPPGWLFEEEGSIYITSSSLGLEQGIFANVPVMIVWRYADSLFPPEDLAEILSEVGIETGTAVESLLSGQEALSAPYTLSSSGGASKGEVTVTKTGGIITVVLLGCKADKWAGNQELLREIQARLKLDEASAGVPVPPLPQSLVAPVDGLLKVEDAPADYVQVSPITFFRARRSDAYYSLWLQGLDPALANQGIERFQGFAHDYVNDNILVFTSQQLTSKQVSAVDSLLSSPQKMANAVNRDPSVHTIDTSDVEYTVLAGAEQLGEKGAGVRITTGNQFTGYIPIDFILIRRGALLAVVRHQFTEEPGIAEEALLTLAQVTDQALQELLAAQPELVKPAAANAQPGEDSLELIAQVAETDFTLPEGYTVNDGWTEEFVQDRFNRFGNRIWMFNQYIYKEGETSEFAQLWVIYPLDETERNAFDWLLLHPLPLTEFFMAPFMDERGYTYLTFGELYQPLPGPLPTTLGEHAGGVTLAYGDFKQDVVVVRHGDLLLAASVLHFGDAEVVADVSDLASQLYTRVAELVP